MVESVLKKFNTLNANIMKNNLLKRFLAHAKTFLLGSALQLMLFGMASAHVHQGVSVTGTVTSSDDGETLPGVNIVEKGTTNGVITDLDGSYNIIISSGATLVFSSVGYVTEEVAVGNQSVINLSLEPDVTQLEELVVIGYGTQKRSELTGSIASIGGDDLQKVPVATVAESLTGRLAGVQVTNTEGSPDSEIRIRVRGGTSITQDSNPLYIVDGFPVSTISDLAPSDIQSIDVLKDASSTAIYGSRGANGVVIVTTKSGKEGKTTVAFNSFFAASKIAKTLDVLDPGDYARWQYEYAKLRNPNGDISSYENYFGAFQDIDMYAGLPANDWQQQIYGQTGNILSNDLSIRGGSEKINYSVNFARFDQKAIMIGSDFVRNNLTLKLLANPNKKVGLNIAVRYSDTQVNGGGANEQNEVSSADSRLKHAVAYSPIPIPGLTQTGDDTDPDIAGDLVNPIKSTADNDRQQARKNLNLGAGFTWNILDNLQWRSDFGSDSYYFSDFRFYGLTTYMVNNTPAVENQGQPAVRLRDREENRYRNTNTLSYDLTSGDHKIRIMGGQELLFFQTRNLYTEVHGLPTLFTSDEAFKLTTQGVPFTIDNNYSPDYKLLSFFSRVNYDYKDRYQVSAVFRTDGSSKFLGDNVWGYFPSLSAGWYISNEGFMQGTEDWLNFLKLRASYGIAGNDNILTGQTSQNFVSRNTAWINNVESFWAPDSRMANPDLKWETTVTKNIGLDFGLFHGRLNGTLELYQNTTENALVDFPVQGSGYASQFRNMGDLENKGIEVSLNTIVIDKADYGLNFNFNIGFNRNKVVSLGDVEEILANTGWASTQIGADYYIVPGRPIGNMYGYLNDGRYEVSDFEFDAGTGAYTLKEGIVDSEILDVRPGMMKLKDLDGDGVVTVADQDFIGDANPLNTGGFVLNAYAYGFDLTAAFNWSYGNDIYNANKIEFTTSNQNNQYRNLIIMQETGKRWTNIDWNTGEMITDPTALAAANANTTMWSPYMNRYMFTDWAVEDGSFLRLNTLTMGYTLPAALTEKARLQSLRFYVTGYNIFILTNYSGFDPEVSTRRRVPYTPGVDYSAYPRSRQITFGLNLTF